MFLIVVIGVALLAFIIGDALTNSRNIFGDNTTVAKIGGTKIDYTEYQRRREDLNQQLEEMRRTNPEQAAQIDNQILPQVAINQLMQEAIVLDAADKAGVKSAGNILRIYMLEQQNPEVNKIIMQLNSAGINVQDARQAYDVIFNPKKHSLTDAQVEPYQRAWLAAEKATEKQVRMQGYASLLAGNIKANDLDKKALYNDYVNTANVDVAFLPYGTLDEKKYKVTDAEIEERYAAEKERFKVAAPEKMVTFLAVRLVPSQADQAASKELAAKTVASLEKDEQLDKAIRKEGVNVTHHALRAQDLPAAAKDFITAGGDSAGSKVKLIAENIQGFTVIRLTGRTAQPDSIQLNVVQAINEKIGERALAALNAGLAVDSLSTKFSADSVAGQTDQWIPLYTAEGATNALDKEVLDSLRNAGGKFVPIMKSPQGMIMAQVVKQNPDVTIYEYDEASYVLAPSQQTKNDERAKLEKFLGANNTAEKFKKNAQKAGYTVMNYTITADDPAIPLYPGANQYFPESRQLVRWVMMDGEKDQVSHVYASSDSRTPAYYAVAIDDEYEGYAPVTNEPVREMLTQEIRRDKAGDAMVKEYSKKAQNLASAAAAMKTEVRNIPSLRFGQGGVDAGVAGKIAGSKADKKVVVVKGKDGVYAYQINGVQKEKGIEYNDQQYDRQYMQMLNPDLVNMLKGNKTYKNNVYKFEAGD